MSFFNNNPSQSANANSTNQSQQQYQIRSSKGLDNLFVELELILSLVPLPINLKVVHLDLEERQHLRLDRALHLVRPQETRHF